MATRPKTSKTASKSSSKKTAKPSAQSRDSLRNVRDDIKALTKRLQAADRATNKTVAALEKALSTLADQTPNKGGDSPLRQKQIDEKVEDLKTHLTNMVRNTQKAVSTDLQTVLDDPRIATMSQALDTATARVERAEAEQLRNLTTLKSYIANLAREVDASLETERTARQAEIADCLSKIETQGSAFQQAQARLATIEADTATAIGLIGDKVSEYAEKAAEAREEQSRSMRHKIDDIALETQKNWDLHKDEYARNFEALQTAHETAKSDLNRDLGTLRTRLETLEYGLNPAAASNNAAALQQQIQDAFTPNSSTPDAGAKTQPSPNGAGPLGGAAQTDSSGNNSAVIMPFVASHSAPNAPANPYSAPEASLSPYGNAPEQATPAAYSAPQTNSPYDAVPYSETQTALAAPAEFIADPYSQLATETNPVMAAELMPAPSLGTLDPVIETGAPYAETYDDMPYENPAYAEAELPMDTDRPGGPIKASGGAKRSALFTPSNLRAAVLGVAVLGVGYLAFNTLTGDKTPNQPPIDDVFVESNASDLVIDTAATATSVQSLEPIGTYTDNINQAAKQAKTGITAAVKSGDPVAQYQLGLVKLQNGEFDEALGLLRASANKGQPAAQYRLAKLYETGSGVTRDLETAKDLIEKSASNGNRIAMHDLANFYANGIGGVEQDLNLAAKWFEQAAERGVVDSQYNIGYLYEFGFGVPNNPVQAYVWYSIASSQGDSEAAKRVAVLEGTLSDVEISSAKDRVKGFKPAKIDKAANGIFENASPASKANKKTANLQVSQVQTLLGQLGYSAGPADGQIGAQTRNAIIAFEKANGLPETGRINSALLKQLEFAAGV